MSSLSRKDFEDFFIRVYFGSINENYIDLSIKRAYLDFNRTLHGISKHPRRNDMYEQAKDVLEEELINLQSGKEKIENIKDFDNWHSDTCQKLIYIYEKNGYLNFFVGHAQKWINMSLKYLFALGDERVNGLNHIFPYCHIPIDNIILDKLKKYNCPSFFQCSWSRINRYNEEYLPFEQWIRNTFHYYTPLELEFLLWLDKDIKFL